MHAGRAVALSILLAVLPLSGCIGVDSMADLKGRLGESPDVAAAAPTPADRAPVPVATVSADRPAPGEVVAFDGTGSHDPDGQALRWSWWIDGEPVASASRFNWTFTSPGRHRVRLTVTDASGRAAGTNLTVDVAANAPPTAAIAVLDGPDDGTVHATVGEDLVLSGTRSRDPEGRHLTHTWRFGDGQTGRGETVSHAWSRGGRYTVVLVVEDPANRTDTARRAVAVAAEGRAQGTVTLDDATGTASIPVREDATRLAVTLSYRADVPLEDLDLVLEGPDGSSTTGPDDEPPLPGNRSLRAGVDDPAPGAWVAEVRLDRGIEADWQVAWTVRY